MNPFNFLLFYLFLKNINTEDLYNNYYNCGQNNGAWNDRCFQTPYRDGNIDPVYKTSYQDMHYLVGYTQLQYFDNNEKCKISIYTRVNTNKIFLGSTHKLLYKFGDSPYQTENFYTVTKENDGYPDGFPLSVKIVKTDNEENTVAYLELEEEYFIWNVPLVDHDNTTINNNGQKGAIVELFGWPYEDIIEESDFLNLAGY